jgi:hypothetical protein
MTTLEATMSLLEILSEEDLKRVQNFAKCLLMSQSNPSPFQPLTKEQILSDLDESFKDIDKHNYKSANEYIDDLLVKYDL